MVNYLVLTLIWYTEKNLLISSVEFSKTNTDKLNRINLVA